MNFVGICLNLCHLTIKKLKKQRQKRQFMDQITETQVLSTIELSSERQLNRL